MADWRQTIHLNPEWEQAKAGTVTVHALAAVIAKRLRRMRPFRDDLDAERNDIADEFESFSGDPDADVECFDDIMDRLFDWGDISLDGNFGGKKCCWIDTMSRSPSSDDRTDGTTAQVVA